MITHYMPPHTGGVEQVAETLARIYAAAGHQVEWVACASPLSPGRERSSDGVSRVRVRAVNVLEDRFGMPFPFPLAFAPITRAVRGADVVHLHDCLYAPNLVAYVAARRSGRPLLLTQHVGMVSFGGGAVDPALRFAYRTVGRSVLRHARRLAFVSAPVRDWFVENVDPSLRAIVLPNAVDGEAFRPPTGAERTAARATLGLPGDARVVLFAGRLVAKKNVALLAEALATSRADWRALVVGDGPERGALARFGARLVHVARLPHERMPDAYRAADVFALPSVGEGLPVSVLEALASGLPCVVSTDPGFDDLGNDAGVLRVAPERAALASALDGLLLDSAERSRRGAAARDFAVARHGVAAFGRRYLELVAEAATG